MLNKVTSEWRVGEQKDEIQFNAPLNDQQGLELSTTLSNSSIDSMNKIEPLVKPDHYQLLDV